MAGALSFSLLHFPSHMMIYTWCQYPSLAIPNQCHSSSLQKNIQNITHAYARLHVLTFRALSCLYGQTFLAAPCKILAAWTTASPVITMIEWYVLSETHTWYQWVGGSEGAVDNQTVSLRTIINNNNYIHWTQLCTVTHTLIHQMQHQTRTLFRVQHQFYPFWTWKECSYCNTTPSKSSDFKRLHNYDYYLNKSELSIVWKFTV